MKEKILALRADGYSYNKIVAEVGCAKSTVSYYCGQQQAVKNLKRQRDRRNKVRQYVQSIKTETVCMDCEENYPYYVLEFDHRPDENKLFNIAMYGDHTLEDVKLEMTKCDIVCSNCHKVRTWQRLLKTGDDISPDIMEELTLAACHALEKRTS